MRLALLAAAALAVGACSDTPAGPPTLTVRAQFVQSMYGGEAALVRHEAVPGVMPAMRMALTVADAALLEGVAPGAPVALVLDSLTLEIVGATALPPGTVLDLADDAADVDFSPGALRP